MNNTRYQKLLETAKSKGKSLLIESYSFDSSKIEIEVLDEKG